MMKKMIFFRNLLVLFLLVPFFYACSDDEAATVPLQNTELIQVLKDLGFEAQNNALVKNDKLMNTKYLNLSGKKLKSTEGLEVFENLEVLNLENNAIKTFNIASFSKLKDLNLAKNPDLAEIEGLDKYAESSLEKLILPFRLRHKFGALPLFVKERSKANPLFSAKIEKSIYGDELRDYNYYYIFKNVSVSNYIFRVLGEDNFLVVDKNGVQVEALDMSKKFSSMNDAYDLSIKSDKVESYEDVEILINEGFKFLELPLRTFELTTTNATRIESLDKLDFSGYKILEKVVIDQMPIKEVHFEGCLNLKSVEIGNSNSLDELVPKKPELVTLSLEDSPLLESLNINSMPTLETLTINKNAPIKHLYLTKLGISKVGNLNTSVLEDLYVSDLVAMKEMNIQSEKLTDVHITNTQIEQLDFSKAKKLNGDIVLGENQKLTTVSFPTTPNQECKKIQVYRNKIQHLDLRMYNKIGVLAAVVWTGRVYTESEGIKGAEEGLQELLIDVDNIVANLPQSPGKDWDGSNKPSMVVYLDADFIKQSPTMKKLYQNGGTDKKRPYVKIYKYGYRYREYRNIGLAKLNDFQ